jgi:uncharacterized membrane protein YdjX (TVP38/TMEM64 family)
MPLHTPQVLEPDSPAEQKSHSRFAGLRLLVVLVGVGILLFLLPVDLQLWLREVLSWIAGRGAAGMIVFFLFYVVACILLLPGSLLTLAAGTIYGLERGIPLVSVSATAGATAAFLVARYLARGWVTQRLADHPRFQALDDAVAREGWKIVGLTRLSPLFPFSVLNYLYGLTGVSLRDYVLASWVGMLPGGVLYVYLGSLLRDVAELGSGSRARTPFEWTLYGLGLLATVAVTTFVTRLARQALAPRLESN